MLIYYYKLQDDHSYPGTILAYYILINIKVGIKVCQQLYDL